MEAVDMAAISFVITIVAINCCPVPDAPPGRSTLDGTWELVSHKNQGRELLTKGEEPTRQVIKNGDFGEILFLRTGRGAAVHYTASLAFHRRNSPAQVDIVISGVDENGVEPIQVIFLRGIYEVSDDKLKFCYSEEGQSRPVGFDPKKGHTVLLYKRVK
jgi:uncharacterized protein (TIGR03067 family)